VELDGIVEFSGCVVVLRLAGVSTSDGLEAGIDLRVRISATFCSAFKEESERPACMVSQVFSTSFPRSARGGAFDGRSIAPRLSVFLSSPNI
jgi:hypothetical protein